MGKNKSKLLEMIQVPWILLETGFWATLATYRGMQIRYLKWKSNRINSDIENQEHVVEKKPEESDG